MTSEAFVYLVGAVCFGLSTMASIKLRDDLAVPTSAALAPTVAVLSASLVSPEVWLIAAGPVIAAAIFMIRRDSLLELTNHVGLYLVLHLAISIAPTDWAASERVTLVLVLAMTLLYSVMEVLRQKRSTPGHAHVSADARMWLLLQAVLLCASGLLILVVDALGWPAFVAMAVVLTITKREFEGFALSRVALDQTVRALDRLRSRQLDAPTG